MKRRRLVASLLGIILAAVVALTATVLAGRSPLLGLDLEGGLSVVLQPHGQVDAAKLQAAVNIIDRRVNSLGVANSTVQRQGNDVVIELPGTKNSSRDITEIGTTAQLFFRPVLCNPIPPYAKPVASPTTTTPKTTQRTTPTTPPATSKASSPSTTKSATGRSGGYSLTALVGATSSATTAPSAAPATTVPVAAPPTSVPAVSVPAGKATTGTATTPARTTDKTAFLSAACISANSSSFPTTSADNDSPDNTVIVPSSPTSGAGNTRWVLGPADLKGEIVKNAVATVDTQTGENVVEVTLTGSGLTEFNRVAAVRHSYYVPNATNQAPKALEAIELDGALESAPSIDNAVFSGPVQISGSFTTTQASSLATQLRYGSLPVRFTFGSVATVSALLGHSSLIAGLLSGLGGLALVLLYMIVYYRALGLVVVLGLAVGGALLYAILTELSYTSSLALTLSGIVGVVVSIGITVDSYVVYFERLKDEVRQGRTVRSSVERGFTRAFKTVLTADLVSFMAALILYLFTVGDVKGFAFTLGLSTLLDVFTAYFFIRPIVVLLGRRRTTSETGFLGISRGLGAVRVEGAR